MTVSFERLCSYISEADKRSCETEISWFKETLVSFLEGAACEDDVRAEDVFNDEYKVVKRYTVRTVCEGRPEIMNKGSPEKRVAFKDCNVFDDDTRKACFAEMKRFMSAEVAGWVRALCSMDKETVFSNGNRGERLKVICNEDPRDVGRRVSSQE